MRDGVRGKQATVHEAFRVRVHKPRSPFLRTELCSLHTAFTLPASHRDLQDLDGIGQAWTIYWISTGRAAVPANPLLLFQVPHQQQLHIAGQHLAHKVQLHTVPLTLWRVLQRIMHPTIPAAPTRTSLLNLRASTLPRCQSCEQLHRIHLSMPLLQTDKPALRRVMLSTRSLMMPALRTVHQRRILANQ